MSRKITQPIVLLHAASKVGGMAALAGKLNIARQAIYQWRRIPVDRVIAIEEITGVSRRELRPDLFGDAA